MENFSGLLCLFSYSYFHVFVFSFPLHGCMCLLWCVMSFCCLFRLCAGAQLRLTKLTRRVSLIMNRTALS